MDDLRRWVSAAITASLAVAMTVVVVGLALGLAGGEGLAIPEQDDGLLAAVGQGTPGAIVLLGLLLLALTPLAHVGVAAAVFARLDERRYLLITLGVASVLLGSLLVAALAGGAARG
jgi:uncharacterized membrane protein